MSIKSRFRNEALKDMVHCYSQFPLKDVVRDEYAISIAHSNIQRKNVVNNVNKSSLWAP